MKALTLNEIAAYLQAHDSYVILTHRRPDGDTTGSAVALCLGLRGIGKEAWLLENPQFTPKLRPFLEGLTVEALPENCIVLSVDTATEGLMAFNAVDLADRVEILIDHHERNSGYAKGGYVDPTAAACGEIILDLLQLLKAPQEKKTAEALYLAISTDTGCFRYSNTTANTLMAAATCKAWGADTFHINRVFFMTKRPARLKLEAYLSNTTEFYAGGKIAISIIPTALREELGLTQDDIDDISGFGREIEGVEVAIMIRRETEGGKLSVRSSPNYDASAICARLGGGGHKAAAGATIPGGIEEAKAEILSVLREMELI
ncbi:MAG: bifunctional oligoribonuclease/PAP phosphatase NrnA [Oscillospiraceae bacterium]|nr:bifunctional oligoribonuclease/PAP phosphatase NrnA [Oscillospiraceae bacterium]